ncbi:MAG TPA: sensor histidine kinase [Acidimicrobiia bacterium]|nr:sensor histidine kinase [Acidimicrobiia bacterium]
MRDERASVWPPVGDALLAGALAFVGLSIVAGFDEGGRYDGASTVATVAVLAHTLPIAYRRRAPRMVLGVSLAAGLVYAATGLPLVGLGPAVLVPVYTVAAERSRRDGIVGLVAAIGVMLLADAIVDSTTGLDTLVGNAVVLGAATVVGDGARRRRDLAREHAARADALEQAQAELARQAVVEERLRIARELHDVVAHAMSVVAVQAGTGRVVLDANPDEARAAFRVIEEQTRGALDEMRRLLGVLRDDTSGEEWAPTPGLGDLDRLVAETVADGVSVDVRVDGSRRLPAGLELAAFRVVQEALTNVRKHAGARHVAVSVAHGPDGLVVEVVDDGKGPPSAGRGGHGIAGMRERVAMYGGELMAGPRADVGFAVRATFPVESGS